MADADPKTAAEGDRGTAVHPTAVVDPGAKLGAGVHIGPYCVLYGEVELGDGCWLQNHVTLAGPAKIGPGNRFFAYASVGQQTQDLKYVGEPTFLEIGEGNTFREFVTVNRSTGAETVTRIGNHGNFLAYAHIAHDCEVGDHVIFSNNATLAGHVTVGDHVVLGGLTAVHQFCQIGRHSITGGCSKIVQDVPPYMVADGNPASVRGVNTTGLQRHGVRDAHTRDLKNAYRILYKKNFNLSQALKQLKESTLSEPVKDLVQFIESSERGIIRS